MYKHWDKLKVQLAVRFYWAGNFATANPCNSPPFRWFCSRSKELDNLLELNFVQISNENITKYFFYTKHVFYYTKYKRFFTQTSFST